MGIQIWLSLVGVSMLGVFLIAAFLSKGWGPLPIVSDIAANGVLAVGIGTFLIGLGWLPVTYITLGIMAAAAAIAVFVVGWIGLL